MIAWLLLFDKQAVQWLTFSIFIDFYCIFQPLPFHLNTKIDFVDESVGGSIPKQFIPVILKNFLRIAENGG